MAMKIFSYGVIEQWNEWEIRVTVLFSLFLQVVLILLGSRRKYTKGSLISIILWLSYLSADWIATLSLGTLAHSQREAKDKTSNPKNLLRAFWAPILLLHLGGPDAITAYALEDNELWLRHLLMLGVQLSVAFYIFLKSWTDTALTFIAIPMFVAGFTKYAERTWVLRSSSVKQFEDSLLSAPTEVGGLQLEGISRDAVYLHEGYFLFGMFKYLFANLGLSFDDAQHSYAIITGGDKTSSDAFKLVKVELGFLYDVLYTKATIIYSVKGWLFRAVTFVSSLSALVSFWIKVNNHDYSTMDIAITYALLIGAVCLELLAFVMIIFSDWTYLWLTKHRKSLATSVYTVLSRLQSSLIGKKRCSRYISQQNFISFCLKEKATWGLRIELFFSTYFMIKTYWRREWEVVKEEMEKTIFEELQAKRARYKEAGYDDKTLNQLLLDRGDYVLTNMDCFDKFRWSLTEVEFNHSLLLWHIATSICFNRDLGKEFSTNPSISKNLSDYMLYILLMRPFMLPKWIGRIGYLRHTYKEAMRFFRAKGLDSESEACKVLVQASTQMYPLETMKREKKSKSVLFDGCRLAKQLMEREDRWKIISGVWLEMVTHAASECGWREHAQQLRRGGELLTQVSLLMAHMGLSKQFQIRRWNLGSEANEVGWGWDRSKVQYKIVGQV